MSAFEFAQGDAFPLRLGLRTGRGEIVTPPAGSTATFRMRGRSTGTVVTGSIVLAGDVATWTPIPANTAVPDIYDAQVAVTYPSGEVRKFPSKVGPGAPHGFVVEVCASP